jgi:hypothetical protein
MKVKNQKIINFGIIKVKYTLNNLFITLTDLAGNVLITKHSGLLKFKSYKRKTPYVAGVVLRQLIHAINKSNLKIKLFILQINTYRSFPNVNKSIGKSLNKFKLKNLLCFQRKFKKIHNGIRLKKKRRI